MNATPILLLLGYLLLSPGVIGAAPPASELRVGKAPITIEVTTDYTDMDEALQAASAALRAEEFILDGAIGARGLMAKRTTAAEADYYVVDVSASEAEGRVVLNLTFVKFGSGTLNLEEVAARVEQALS